MTFPHPNSTAFCFSSSSSSSSSFLDVNALFVLGLLDTFFIYGCPACFRAFEQFATLYIYAFTFIHLVLLLRLASIFCLLWFALGVPFIHLGTWEIFVEVSFSSI